SSDGPRKDNTCAVIVSFHPDAEITSRLALISLQVARAVIVDNHSSEDAIARLKAFTATKDVHLILNASNLGIAAALNQGINYAAAAGFSWVLLFDHDSTPIDGLLDAFAKQYLQRPDKNHVAVIGCNYLYSASTRMRYQRNGHQDCEERNVVITS